MEPGRVKGQSVGVQKMFYVFASRKSLLGLRTLNALEGELLPWRGQEKWDKCTFIENGKSFPLYKQRIIWNVMYKWHFLIRHWHAYQSGELTSWRCGYEDTRSGTSKRPGKKKITKKFWSGGIWRMKYWKKHLRTVEINCWHHMNLNWQKKWTLPQRIDISDLIRVARAGYSRNICICPALIRSDRASPDRHRRSSLFISLAFILSLVKSDVVEKTGTVGKLEKSLPVWVW